MSNCFLSHRISYLAREIGNSIYRSKEISRKIIVTDQCRQKEYLTSFFMDRYGISMGFHWLQLCQVTEYLFSIVGQNSYKFPNISLLTLHIEQEIKRSLKQKDPVFLPLQKYLDARASSIRLYKIANYLASLFVLYGNVEFEILEQWLKKNEWQQELFMRLMSHWEIPSTFAKRGIFTLPFRVDIHFFHCSYISKTLLRFFESKVIGLQCYFYVFSPTSLYWGDLHSDRKASYLSRHYTKHKVPEQYILAVNSYVKSENTFLSNLAEFGQTLLNYAIEKNWDIKEDFARENGETLLHNLQKTLVADACDLEKIDYRMNSCDDSIQVHRTISMMQELEILYRTIGKIIESDPKLDLSDIMVVAPNIATYAPLIPFVFSKKNSNLPYVIDGNNEEINELLRGIVEILQLVGSSLDISSVRTFLSLPLVQKKFALSERDIEDFFILVEKMNVSWGFNIAHRTKVLNTRREDSNLDDTGTWEYFFDRILYGFCMVVDCQNKNFEEKVDYQFFPSCNLSFTKAPWIGVFYSIVNTIYQNICGRDTEEMEIERWVSLLFQWIDTLLIEEFDSCDAGVHLKKHLCNIYKLPLTCRTSPISFNSFSQFLRSVLREYELIPNRIGKICFSSLQQGKITPSKILCILGFDADSFPKKQQENSLHDLKVDEIMLAQCTAQDRFCFLEILHQAEDKLLFFFNAFDPLDGKEREYSHLISELFDYLDATMGINSYQQCFIDHHTVLPTAKEKVFLLHYENKSVCEFDQSFQTVGSGSIPQNFHIANLFRLAKNPIYIYFQVKFGIFWKSEYALDQYHLTVSNLDRFIIKNSLFRYPSDHILQLQQVLGKLPSGAFKNLASQTILLEEKKIHEKLSCVNKPIFSVYIHPDIVESIQWVDMWFIPSTIYKDICDITLKGELHNVSPSGLLCQGKIELQNLCREWPRIVLFMSIVQKHCHCVPEVIFLEDKKTWKVPPIDWENALREYIFYYRIASQVISPLHPKWMKFFLTDQEDQWCDMVRSSQIDFGSNLQWLKEIFPQVAPLPFFYRKWYEYVQTKLTCLLESCKSYENI
ncbi:MAG: exodeoxyribonuclease V subunit gamma [Chlamydiales bacterium]